MNLEKEPIAKDMKNITSKNITEQMIQRSYE